MIVHARLFADRDAAVRDEMVLACARVFGEIERLWFPDLFQRALPQSEEVPVAAASAEKNEEA